MSAQECVYMRFPCSICTAWEWFLEQSIVFLDIKSVNIIKRNHKSVCTGLTRFYAKTCLLSIQRLMHSCYIFHSENFEALLITAMFLFGINCFDNCSFERGHFLYAMTSTVTIEYKCTSMPH